MIKKVFIFILKIVRSNSSLDVLNTIILLFLNLLINLLYTIVYFLNVLVFNRKVLVLIYNLFFVIAAISSSFIVLINLSFLFLALVIDIIIFFYRYN